MVARQEQHRPHTARGLDPETLLAIRDLELRARVVVQGLWSGLHRSPFSGFSVEFTEYRQYVPGDDLRYMDWRVLARTDREYVRKFEDETNLRCHLLIDHSRSMTFGSRSVTKAEYARTLAACLGYFLLQQRDMVGLALFGADLIDHLPARWRPGHLRRLLAMLEREHPAGETRLDLALEQAARLWRKRAVVVLVSDFLGPVEAWTRPLARLVAAGHDVRAIQVLDPAEISLEFGRAAEWMDLETGRRLFLDPAQARTGYQSRFQEHAQALRAALDAAAVPLHVATTDHPIDLTLLEWLKRSQPRGARARRGSSLPRR